MRREVFEDVAPVLRQENSLPGRQVLQELGVWALPAKRRTYLKGQGDTGADLNRFV